MKRNWGNVLVQSEQAGNIFSRTTFGEKQEECHDEGQYRSFQQVDQYALLVRDRRQEVPFPEHLELPDLGSQVELDLGKLGLKELLHRNRQLLGAIHLIPSFRRDPSLIRFPHLLIHQLGFEEVEYLLGFHVSTSRALALLPIHVTNNALKAHHRVHGISLVSLVEAAHDLAVVNASSSSRLQRGIVAVT